MGGRVPDGRVDVQLPLELVLREADRPSALMMSWSAVAMSTSVWTTSIGASEPTSILILVMRFSSTAIA